MYRLPLVALASLILATAACGGVDDTASEGRVSQELVGGTETYDRPAIGMLMDRIAEPGPCTATLVSPTVAITAAHCFGFRSELEAGDFGTLTLQRSASEKFTYKVDRFVSYSAAAGPDDVALMHLSTAVPGDVAAPLSIARVIPADATVVDVFGYGCTRRSGGGDKVKRKLSYPHGTAQRALCFGDSGGPVVAPDGTIFQLADGYFANTGLDAYSAVTRHYTALTAQIAKWDSCRDIAGNAVIVGSSGTVACGDGERTATCEEGGRWRATSRCMY